MNIGPTAVVDRDTGRTVLMQFGRKPNSHRFDTPERLCLLGSQPTFTSK